jgi:hypothetical protein
MTQPNPQPAHTGAHRWLVSEDSAGLFPINTGSAESEAAAWTAAFAAGREALLAGRIRYLAIAVDDEIPTAGYSPSRDRHGRLDPDQVTEDLDEALHDTLRDLPVNHPGRRSDGVPMTIPSADTVWFPAELYVPHLLEHLMYMGNLEYSGRTIHQYKHTVTRRYINLEDNGQAWRVNVSPLGDLTARPITLVDAEEALTR